MTNSSEDNSEKTKSRFSQDISTDLIISLGEVLGNFGNYNFKIFKLFDICPEKGLLYLSHEIFSYFDYFEDLIDESKFKSFTSEIINGYGRKNSYHNDIHGADVMQTLFVLINKGNLAEIDILSTLISAMCHDYKHTGFSNNYEINLKSQIALTYNDSSVLENFHISETFKTLLKPENNITSKFIDEQYRLFRRRVIDSILATDMANHIKHLSSLRTKAESFDIINGKNLEKMINTENSTKTYENQQMILGMCIHCSDISNPAKPEEVYDKWVELVFVEFFHQGDLERQANIPISLLCDRNTTNINKSQIGFINFIVKPTFDCLKNFIPELNEYIFVIEKNLKRYEKNYALEQEKK